MAPDALMPTRLILNRGGKKVSLMNKGWIFKESGEKVEHFLQTENGVQKGLRSILLQRQFWTAGLKVKEATTILAEQVDFASQKGWLEETIVSGGIGMKVIFYPKFHCEFNFIELYWVYCKRYLRSNCDYSSNGLNELLPKALDSVPLSTIRKFARKCWRYMDAYRSKNGQYLTSRQIEYAVREYRGHRTIPQSIIKEHD
jgi:hypothetical protein